MNSDRYDISNDSSWNHCFNLLFDPEVSEIASNGPGRFFYKKGSKRLPIEMPAAGSDTEYRSSIVKGLIPHVKSIETYNEEGYLFEGPLILTNDEGESIQGRCHIVLPPVTNNPQVTIAKKSTSLIDLDHIAEAGSMSSEMLQFLKLCVRHDLTIVVSGSTGAGKTTMLEALSKLWPTGTRIGVAEDTPELVLIQPDVTYSQSVPWRPGLDPNKVATLSWVVQQFQRQRIDKVIVGETRGVEFADFLIAANSGMDGSLTTLHANDPNAALDKMTNFSLRASPGSNVRVINYDIASAVNIVVQINKFPDGRYRTTSIAEVTKTLGNDELAKITAQPLFTYDSASDSFTKDNNITDPLREHFQSRGVDLNLLTTSPVGSIATQHSSDRFNEDDLPYAQKGLPVQIPTRNL